MKYKNTKTGAVINTVCKVSGANWVELKKNVEVEEQAVKTTPQPETKVSPAVAEDDEEMDGITVKEIKQELDAFGVEYDPKAKKKELYDLMMSQGK